MINRGVPRLSAGCRDSGRLRGVPVKVLVSLLATAVVMAAAGPGVSVAEFEDNEGVHAPAVDALDGLGVFEGTACGEGLFCPREPILRWVVAVWLVRVLDDSEPQAESSRFVDVDDAAWWMPHVERLMDLGVTRGCATEPARFCPEDPVTRAQMASFLSRAFGLEVPEGPLEVEFSDVGEGVHTDSIYALLASGITVGCAAEPEARYCPDRPTTRAQMASFLKRAYSSYVGPCPTEATSDTAAADEGGGGGGGGSSGPARAQLKAEASFAAAPQSVTVDPGDGTLTVTWSPPPAAGAEVVVYRVQWKGPDEDYSDTERWVIATGLRYEIVGLTNGETHSVRVAAGFAGYGFGDWAATLGVPSLVPGAPRSVDVVPGDEKLAVRWQPPADHGGSPVTEYRVEHRADGVRAVEDVAPGSSHEIDGLANGVEYRVRVAAVNPAGMGDWSETIEEAPEGPPDAPRGLAVERGDRSAAVEWRAPADDGGSDVTAYKVQWRTGRQTFNQSSRHKQVSADHLSYTVTGLANGTEHFVRVLAVNAVGDGEGSAEASFTPATNPGPPRSVAAARGDRSVSVTWAAPTDTGGSAVTAYKVQWRTENEQYDSSRQATVSGLADLSYTVTGLANGTEHFVRVLAVNDVGDGEDSAEVSFTPATTPGAPRSVAAARGHRSIAVTWAAADDGGSAVTAYKVQWRADDGDFEPSDPQATVGGREQSHRITGLAGGTEYFVRVYATNDVDDGPWSTSASATPAMVAGPPRSVAAARGDRSIVVTWAAPADTGGSAVTGYKVQWRTKDEQYHSSREATVADLADLSHEVTGLANGTEHFVRVVAANDVGDGQPSAEAPFTPATTPGAPRSVAAARGDRSVMVTWAAAVDGGAAVIGHRVQWRAGDRDFEASDPQARVGAGLSHRIGNLANGTEYFVRVMAINGVDDGPWSSSASAIPATSPGRPQSVAAVRGDRSVSVSWRAPADEGGSAVVGYRVQWRAEDEQYDLSRQATVTDLADLSHEITGLTNGTKYFVRVAAVNGVGDRESAQRSATPATLPGVPGDFTLEARDRSLGVSWTVPDDGGSRILSYRMQWRADDGDFDDRDRSRLASVPPPTAYRIGSLTNGTEYFVRVRATNDVDDGPWSPTMSAPAAVAPGAPRNIAAQPADGSLTVTWQAPASNGGGAITEYKVQWRRGPQQYSETYRQATVSGTSHQIPGLFNGFEYWVRVRAVNLIGAGPSATVMDVPRTLPGPPGTPVVHSSPGSLSLSWDRPENDGGSIITEYRVQWKGPDQEYNETDRLVTVTAPRHRIMGLTNDIEYTVRIAAVNDIGLGPAVEASKVVATLPGAPRSPRVIVNNASLYVSWTPPETAGNSPITEYLVLWKRPDQDFNDSRCSFRRVSVPNNGDLSGVIGPLRNGTTYDIKVAAVNDAGPGPAAEISGTPAAIPGPPRAVGAFSVDGGLLVDWDVPWDGGSPITGYRVQWKGSSEEYNDSDRLVTVGASTLSHEITGLTNGSEYTVRVGAVNANGTSRISQTPACPAGTDPATCDGYVAEATGTPGDAPGPPSSTVAQRDYYDYFDFSCGSTVTWQAPTDPGGSALTGYRVQWKLPWDNHYSEPVEITGLTQLSYQLVLDPWECRGRAHLFRISAVNAAGVGPPAEADGN